MSTSPYLPAAGDLVRTSHEQRVTLTLTSGEESWSTALLGGDLTLDEGWTPRGQLSAVIPNIFSVDQLAAIDPRTSIIRATITAGYVHPDGTVDVHQLFDGHLRSRDVMRPANTVQLQAWTDEGLAHDARWLAADLFKSFAGVTEALEWFASYATGDTITMDSSVGTTYRADLTASIPTVPGRPVWEFMDELCLSAGVHCFVDPDGGWKIRGKVDEASTTDITVLDDVDESEDGLTRDQDYYSAAVIKYSWQDALGDDHEIFGRYGTLPGKVYYTERETSATQTSADLAAQSIVKSLSTRGDSYIGTSPACYWLRPSRTVRVTLADGTTVDQILKSVVFQLAAGTMRTTTRQPSNLGDA
jgi:hypothetical protein